MMSDYNYGLADPIRHIVDALNDIANPQRNQDLISVLKDIAHNLKSIEQELSNIKIRI